MINAKELRIGNYIIGEHGKIQPVEYVGDTIGLRNEVGGTDKHQANPIFSYDIEKLKQVEINSEWFIKFGFAFSGESVLFKDLFEVAITKNKKFYLKGLSFGIVEIKYIHQLQNLHYCLTGEELECSI